MTELMTCNTCAETLPSERFVRYKAASGNIVHRTKCRDCDNNRRKALRNGVERKRQVSAAQDPSATHRMCTTCRENKPVGDYYRCNDGKLKAACRPCAAAKQHDRRVRQAELEGRSYVSHAEQQDKKPFASYDYGFAVLALGMNHNEAIEWVADGYELTVDTIRGWDPVPEWSL